MFRPLRDYVLVRPMERVKSDVLLVQSEEKPNFGVIEAVGPGKVVKGKLRPLDVKVGDTVRFGSGENYLTYPRLTMNKQEYLLLQEADVCWVQDATA